MPHSFVSDKSKQIFLSKLFPNHCFLTWKTRVVHFFRMQWNHSKGLSLRHTGASIRRLLKDKFHHVGKISSLRQYIFPKLSYPKLSIMGMPQHVGRSCDFYLSVWTPRKNMEDSYKFLLFCAILFIILKQNLPLRWNVFFTRRVRIGKIVHVSECEIFFTKL